MQVEIIRRMSNYSTATLHEAAAQTGALAPAIKPITPDMRLCGPAVTVRTAPGNNVWLHRAIYAAQPGDVLVADVRGQYDAGYWGEIMTLAAVQQKLGGLVIDGCVRDSLEIVELGFPVFARGLCIRGTDKSSGAVGAINTPLAIDQVQIQAGDLIVGDADGVVVIAKGAVGMVLEEAANRVNSENEMMQKIKDGARTVDLFNIALEEI